MGTYLNQFIKTDIIGVGREPLFTPYHLKMARTESVYVNAGQTLTLANISGSGVVTTLWVATEGTYRRDAVINIYVDGETTPSITFDNNDTGILGLSTGRLSTLHSEVEIYDSNYDGSFTFYYPIPYSSSIKIDIVAPSTGGFNSYAQVFYTSDVTYSWRLKSASKTWANHVRVPAGGSYTFLNIQGKGHLLYTMIGWTSSGITPVESDILFYKDGETTPSIASSGMEDWIHFSFASRAGAGSTPYSFAVPYTAGPYWYSFAIDLLGWCGGLKFDTACKLAIDSSEATTSYDMCYLILYKLDP